MGLNLNLKLPGLLAEELGMLINLIVSAAMAQSIPAGVEAVPGEYLIKLKSSRSFQTIQSKVVGGISFKG